MSGRTRPGPGHHRRRSCAASPSASPASSPTTTSTSPCGRGTVHAIVGENGAGKSTLMKILYGMQQPGRGQHRGRRRGRSASHSPADAIAAGIGMVHQHFMLADNLTVLENVVLGAEPGSSAGSTSARPAQDHGDLRRVRPRRRPGRAGRGPRRRRPAAGRDPQGALPRRPDPHPRRADRGAGAAGGRRAVRQPARAQVRGPHRSCSSRTSSTRCSRSPTRSP